MADPLLEVEELTVQYRTRSGNVTAVSDASFTIDHGEYFGVVGESGCGKSTIANAIIGGLDRNGVIESGRILLNGREIQHLSERELNERVRWKEISWIPQGSMSSLDPIERISDQVAKIARTHTDLTRAQAVDRLRELFTVVGLDPERVTDYPIQFSGGMQQRALIAFSLILEPSLIIADEPTTALDVIMQDQVFTYLDKITAELDTSVMLITHDISLVFESCDQMAVMHGGQVAEIGPVVDLYDSPRHPYSILLQRAFPHIHRTGEKLDVIEGSPPLNLGQVNSCTFVDRCPWAREECRQSQPRLEPLAAGSSRQKVACFRREEVSGLAQREVH